MGASRRLQSVRDRSLPSSWRPLSVYAETEDGVRHATWLELFFDLVFVVAVAELGSHLHHHLTPVGVLQFAGLFVIVWWVWLGYSYYADMYDATDLISRLTMLSAMFVVIFLSLSIDGAFEGNSFAFALAVLILRTILTGLHFRARHVDSEARPFLAYWLGSEVLTTLVWASSLLVPEPGRYGLWVAALAINVSGMFILYTFFDSVLVQISHFPERLGLFTILVLGEAILAVSFGTSIAVAGATMDVMTLLTGAAGFLIAVGTWWLYFNRFDEQAIDRALGVRDDGWLQARQRGMVYVFSHYLIHIGIVAIGIGTEVAIESSLAAEPFGTGGLLAFCGGMGAFLVGTGICHRALDSRIDTQVFGARLGAVVVIGLVAVVAGVHLPLVLVGSVALLLVGLIVFEGVLHTEVESIEAGVKA